jgi:ketosteroid isomerase-like protein
VILGRACEKAAVVRRLIELLDARDAPGIAEIVHPQFEFVSLLASVEGRRYRGVDGLREYFADVEQAWEGVRFELEELKDGGELALLAIRVYGRARASGVPLDQLTHQVWT